MSSFGTVPPGGGWTAPPPPAGADVVLHRPRRTRRLLIAGLIAVVVVAGTVGGILGVRLLGGSADSLSAMAPSDTVAYVNAHLDPSAGQKLALDGLLDKFPSLGGSSRDATINGWIDSMLQPSGLTHGDVRPWLGGDISFVVPSGALSSFSSSSSGSPPDAVLLVSSTNDSQALRAISTLRQRSGHSEQWVTSTYEGVTLQVVSGDQYSGAFAVTNHVFVFGSTESAVHEVIDTAHGKHAPLASNGSYATAVTRVPSDHIGFAFVDLGAIVRQLPKGAGGLLPAPSLGSVQGFTGIAAALIAQGNGVSVTGVEDFDPAKLSAGERAQLTQVGDVNGSLAFMPRSAYAAGMLTGLKQTVQGLIGSIGSGFGFDINSVLQQIGLTGPNGILNHLSGDAGLDLTPSATSIPGGAIVIGTDSASAAQQFAESLLQTLCGTDCSSSITTEQDGDATISTLAVPFLDTPGFDPSWSVYHGWIVIGSSPQQVRAAIDADRSGHTLATNPDYTAVMSQVGGSNNGSLFIDIQPMLRAIRATLSPADQSQFDTDVAPNLKPLKAFGVATHNASDHVSIDMFTLIQ